MMPAIKMKRGHILLIFVFIILFWWLFIGRSVRYKHPCNVNQGVVQKLKSHYCNPPAGPPVTGQEGLISKDLYNLELVQMVIRHGDRYYINPVNHYHPANISCLINSELIKNVPEMDGYQKTMAKQVAHTSVDHPLHGFKLYPNKAECDINMLTPIGAAQHIRNALFLRGVYIDKWKMFKLTEPFNKQLMMRSTQYARTVQSGLAFMYGFIPQFDLNYIHIERAPYNNMCIDGLTVPKCECRGIDKFRDTMSVSFGQHDPSFLGQKNPLEIRKSIAELLELDVLKVSKLGHILDMSMVHQCHDEFHFIYKDKCMPAKFTQRLHEIMSENGRHNLNNPSFNRMVHIKMHPLLLEITTRMVSITLSSDDIMRFILYSAHDTTLEPLAAMLGISDGTWPRYAARLVVEFYSSKKVPKDLEHSFVRFLLDGKDLTNKVIFCKDFIIRDGQQYLCPFSKLKHYVDVENLQQYHVNNEEACQYDI